eukprot:1624957-Alexandrium_andersonii.AAC.1
MHEGILGLAEIARVAGGLREVSWDCRGSARGRRTARSSPGTRECRARGQPGARRRRGVAEVARAWLADC